MKLARGLIKIAVFPILILVWLLKWAWIFLSRCTQIFFYLVAFILFLTAVGGYAFGLENGTETIRTMMVGFLFFMIPVTASAVTGTLIFINEMLIEFIFS